MKLIADGGSTTVEWCVLDGSKVVAQVSTEGMNAMMLGEKEMAEIIGRELMPHLQGLEIDEVQYYGAGCLFDNICNNVRNAIAVNIPSAKKVTVDTDLLAAARAVCGNRPGIVCILGTGSNSCYYDGTRIADNVPSLGYILGDEGSGAVLGRMFINALFKCGLSAELRDEFLCETGLTLADIINKVYREPMANRFLASTSVFIRNHLENKALRCLVVDNFKSFFKCNVNLYGCRDLPVGAVGSIAFYYKSELLEAAEAEGYKVGKVIKSPMEGLVRE